MGILKRDQKTIEGLRTRLNELQSAIDGLGNDSITAEQKAVIDKITQSIETDFESVLTDLQVSQLVSELNDDNKVATVRAIREYVLGAFQLSGPSAVVESLTIYSNTINLTHRPHPGITGIMNYGTGRIKINGVTRYLDLVETADPYKFTVNNEGFNLEGKSIKVQYLYYYDPRDLNDMIGNLIADGLTLIVPDETTTVS